MFKFKKLLVAVLTLGLIVGLFGCAGKTQSGETGSVVSKESSAEASVVSEISSEITSSEAASSVEYVPLDRFEDANIINTEYTRAYLAQNETTGSLGAAADWAVLFVTRNYQAFSPKYIYAEPLSGVSPDPSVFVGNETSFVLRNFCVHFNTTGVPDGLTPEEDGSFDVYLQVVMKESDDHQLTLLGFVTSQTQDINRPSDLAEFLKVLPEYADLKVAVPEPDAPLESVNLTEMTGGLHIIGVWPVGDALYVFGFDPDYRFTDEKFTTIYLKAYSLETLTPLYEESFPSTHSNNVSCLIEDGILIFTPDNTDSQPYYRATADGVSEIDYVPEDENSDQLYRLSDTAVIRQSGIDLLLEKDGETIPLLTGVPYDDNSDVCTRYRFLCRVSDTAFAYIKMGWEFPIESGIYDIETGKTTLFTHKNANSLVPIAVLSGRVVITPYWDSSYTSYGPYLFDLASGQLTDLGWFDQSFYQSSSKFLCFDNIITSFSKTRFGMSVLLCDFSKSTTPQRFDSLNYNSAEPSTIFNTAGYLWFTSEADSFSDTYLFRIPITG